MVPQFTAGLIVALCSTAAFAQAPTLQSSTATADTTAPVAYVYISAGTQVFAYSTSSAGTLTKISTTNMSVNLWHLTVTKKFLFGIDGDSNIYTFAIQPNGGLVPLPVLNGSDYAPDTCFGSGIIQAEESGENLYAETGSCHDGSFVNSFKILPTGDLEYLGKAPVSSWVISQLRFSDQTHYAYQTGCQIQEANNSATATAYTDSFKRESNGYITYLGTSHEVPEGSGRKSFCPFTMASDSANHLVLEYMRYMEPGTGGEFGEMYGTDYPLAVYTVASDGSITTTSNYGNMAASEVYPTTISISPSNQVLAVGGDDKYQFFHFHGAASQPVKWTGVFSAGDSVMELGWDKADHFYAMTPSSLVMYHITATGYKQLTGLPAAFANGNCFIVLSL